MRRFVIGGVMLFLAALALDAYPGLRGGSGWRWPYALPESAAPVLILAGGVLLYIGVIALLRRRQAPAQVTLPVIVLFGAVMAVAVVGVRGDALQLLTIRTLSPVQTGASTMAVNYIAQDGVHETLANWPDLMRAAGERNIIHFTTSPPGQPLAHHWLTALFKSLPDASHAISDTLRPMQCTNMDVMVYTREELASVGIIGVLMPLWAALLALPIYAAARTLTDDPQTALRIAAWSPLFPTILLFMPVWNVLYPALVALSFALLLRDRPLFIFLAGAVFSWTTFLNFAVLPVLLIFGLFVLGDHMRRTSTPRAGFLAAVQVGVWFGLGLLVCWLPYIAATGITPLDIWQVTQEKHSALVQRDYLPWLVLHPYDTLLFIGWPVTALFFAGVIRAWGKRRTLTRIDILAAATLTTIIAVNLVGIVQGENGRIMSFYAPFILLAGAGIIAQNQRDWDMPLLATQALTVLVMAAVLPVVPLDLNPPPTAPRTDLSRLDGLEMIPVEATFSSTAYDGAFQLVEHRFVADLSAQAITLETVWAGDQRPERPYIIEVVASANNAIDGDIITAPQRWPTQRGNYLPTCWQAGDVIPDVEVITLPAISAPVVWTLSLRMVDIRSGDMMTVTLPDGTQTDAVTLAPVNYP